VSTALPVPTTRTTPPLLAAGAAGGPVFVAAVLVQAYTRDGFDPARHPLSSLSLGGLGWIQVTNFVLRGLLTVAGAVGLRRHLAPGIASRWGPRLLGAGGVALVMAGLFRADPVNGYPPAAVDAVTCHGSVHSLAPAAAGLAGLAAYVLFAWRFAAGGERGWLGWTVAAPLLIITANATSAATGDFRALLLGQAVGAAWTTSLFHKVR
jgi:hypothetical protein